MTSIVQSMRFAKQDHHLPYEIRHRKIMKVTCRALEIAEQAEIWGPPQPRLQVSRGALAINSGHVQRSDGEPTAKGVGPPEDSWPRQELPFRLDSTQRVRSEHLIERTQLRKKFPQGPRAHA